MGLGEMEPGCAPSDHAAESPSPVLPADLVLPSGGQSGRDPAVPLQAENKGYHHNWICFRCCVASQKHDVMGATDGVPCLRPPPFWDRFVLVEFLGIDWVQARPGAAWVPCVSCSVAALVFQCISTSVLITSCHLTRLKKKRLRSKWHS